jgi:dipeptidyl aminopeptidase/acylaminoacyl peptidase
VETVTRIDGLPRTDLRTSDGKLVMEVEQAEAVGLPENWNWPEPVSLLAADGETEIRGVVFRPSDFSPDKSYPVIDHIYGGPQVTLAPESLTGMSFTTAQSLAELGFIVVVIDGRGTTERSRAFHESSYGAIETASNLEDHIAGVKQLAERYPYMDVERVGITGFSGGGYMTAHAMLRFPDFYKVGVSGAGNHDQRLFWHSWGERYNGLLEGDNYLQQANLTHAANLEGKILFIHGLLDHGVHAAGLFQLTQALMNENKKFDLVILPQAGHELPGYAMVRMWDYFVEHLAGLEPPEDFATQSSQDLMKARLMAIQAESMGGADTDAGASEEQRLE